MDQFSDQPFGSLNEADVTSVSGSDRRNLRDSLFLAATMTIDGDAHEVRVRNLSSNGLMAEFAHPLPIGSVVMLDMRGIGRIAGRVAWATDGRIGIALDRPIDPMAARKPVAIAKLARAKDKPIRSVLQ